MPTKAKVKLAAAVTLAFLMAVVVFQNTDPVATRILFITLTMPRAALLLITLLIGVVLGILLSFTFAKRPRNR